MPSPISGGLCTFSHVEWMFYTGRTKRAACGPLKRAHKRNTSLIVYRKHSSRKFFIFLLLYDSECSRENKLIHVNGEETANAACRAFWSKYRCSTSVRYHFNIKMSVIAKSRRVCRWRSVQSVSVLYGKQYFFFLLFFSSPGYTAKKLMSVCFCAFEMFSPFFFFSSF